MSAWGYRALLLAQVGFYTLALAGRIGAAGRARRLAAIAHYFVAMNAALAVGFWRFVRGAQAAAWQRTPRAGASVAVRGGRGGLAPGIGQVGRPVRRDDALPDAR